MIPEDTSLFRNTRSPKGKLIFQAFHNARMLHVLEMRELIREDKVNYFMVGYYSVLKFKLEEIRSRLEDIRTAAGYGAIGKIPDDWGECAGESRKYDPYELILNAFENENHDVDLINLDKSLFEFFDQQLDLNRARNEAWDQSIGPMITIYQNKGGQSSPMTADEIGKSRLIEQVEGVGLSHHAESWIQDMTMIKQIATRKGSFESILKLL